MCASHFSKLAPRTVLDDLGLAWVTTWRSTNRSHASGVMSGTCGPTTQVRCASLGHVPRGTRNAPLPPTTACPKVGEFGKYGKYGKYGTYGRYDKYEAGMTSMESIKQLSPSSVYTRVDLRNFWSRAFAQ